MNYRELREAQRKYIQTKKEARELKEERINNPRPPRSDPPPARLSSWAVVGLVLLVLLPVISLFFLFPNALVAQTPATELTVWICGTQEEYEQIKSWLEPEILANELNWAISHAASREHLFFALRSSLADLAVVEEETARELYQALALAPLSERLEGATWENSFAPFWEPQPFRKTLGWVVPRTGRIEEGRHLYTVMRQFAEPFRPEQQPPL